MTQPPFQAGVHSAAAKDLDMADWENDIAMYSLDEKLVNVKEHDPLRERNENLDSDDWLKEVIWDTNKMSPDLVEEEDEEAGDKVKDKKDAPEPILAGDLDQFNLSNDHLYEHTRASRFRIRQTFGAIEVFHSHPAKVLQMPFYKTTLSKNEARAWHRPALQFPSNVWLGFTKLRSNPNNSQKRNKLVADPSERFKTTKDLSLAEKGPYVLLEFSEESPPIMSGYGMGTTIVNYYRKKDDRDDTVPKLELGQPSILNVGDDEPFLLGYVDPGKVTQVIHNNLIRAPIFKHQPEPTDFLVIR
jgi:transcription initiation factor TFIID subunit 1